MIEKLQQIEDKKIIELLSKPELWQTKLVNYFPPTVERCWIQLGNYRLLLHFIHECKAEEALFHTHRWPSAMHILHGKYEMGLGFGTGEVPPPKMATILFENGGYYDMTHIDGWHYVRPIGGVCATTMLTGPLWDREETAKEFPALGPLTEQRKMVLLNWFLAYYRERVQGVRVEENKKISRGDWVKIDESMMTSYEKKKLEVYLGQNGFVIGREDANINVRFGSDRTQINSKFLTLLDPSTKPLEKDLSKKDEKKQASPGKKLDPMDPKSWDEENFEEI